MGRKTKLPPEGQQFSVTVPLQMMNMIYKSLLRSAAVVIVFAGGTAYTAEEPIDDDATGVGGLMYQTVPVADEDAAGDAAMQGGPRRRGQTDLREQLLDEFSNYKRLMSEGIYDEADTVANRVFTLYIQLTGPRSK